MKNISMRLPFGKGRLLWTPDKGEAFITADQMFATHLLAEHFRGGKKIEEYDLGSGLVTNVGVTALTYDYAYGQFPTFQVQNYHATGTGTTAATASDIQLQAAAAPTATTGVAGTPSQVSAANSQTWQNVGTINYTSSLAITEWGLFSTAALSGTTGTPFTATTTTGGTVTGTPLTSSSTSTRGLQQYIVAAGGAYGVILSNTTSVITIPAWYSITNGTSVSKPGNTAAYTLQPVMWDHRVFSQINVNNLDSIIFTYDLLCASGG